MKIKRGKEISIKRSIFFSLIIVATLSIVFMSLAWFITEVRDLKKTIAELNERGINQQKEYLKYEVEKTISYIEFIKDFRNKENPDSIKNEVLEKIAHTRLNYGGYIFVNTIEGRALVFDGERVEGYKDISNMADPKGLRLFDLEKKAYYNPDGDFMEYLFKPIDSEIPEDKISYMKGFPEWGWIIGAGIYKKTPEQHLASLEIGYYKIFEKELFFIGLVSFLLIILSYFLVRHLDNRLLRQVEKLKNSLQKVAHSEEYIDLSQIQFTEFKKIGRSVNEMIKEKKILTKQIIDNDRNLKSIFSAAESVGFIFLELDNGHSYIKEFSPGAEKIFGYKKSEVLNKDAEILHYTDDYQNFIKIQQLLLDGLTGFNGETKLIGKNHKPIAALFTMHPLYKDGDIKETIAVIVDISNRKKAEEELKELKDNLERKVEERTKEVRIKNEELTRKNEELEHYNNLFVGREFRINELKIKIKELEKAIENKN